MVLASPPGSRGLTQYGCNGYQGSLFSSPWHSAVRRLRYKSKNETDWVIWNFQWRLPKEGSFLSSVVLKCGGRSTRSACIFFVSAEQRWQSIKCDFNLFRDHSCFHVYHSLQMLNFQVEPWFSLRRIRASGWSAQLWVAKGAFDKLFYYFLCSFLGRIRLHLTRTAWDWGKNQTWAPVLRTPPFIHKLLGPSHYFLHYNKTKRHFWGPKHLLSDLIQPDFTSINSCSL